MAEDEVGSLGQETLRLLRALTVDPAGGPLGESDDDGPAPSQGDHVCTTSWCPLCQVVGYVKQNPEVVEEIAAAAMNLVHTVRDAFDAAARASQDTPDEETPP